MNTHVIAVIVLFTLHTAARAQDVPFVVAKHQDREKAIQSGDITWIETRTYMSGYFDEIYQHEPTVKGQFAPPQPSKDTDIKSSYRFRFSNRTYRMECDNLAWNLPKAEFVPDLKTHVMNQEIHKVYTKLESISPWMTIKRRDKSKGFFEKTSSLISHSVRACDPAVCNSMQFDELRPFGDRSMLIRNKDEFEHDRKVVVSGSEYDYEVMEYYTSKNQIASRLSVNEWKTLHNSYRIPQRWTCEFYRDRKLVSRSVSTLQSCVVNCDIDDAELTSITLAPGTRVTDYTDPKNPIESVTTLDFTTTDTDVMKPKSERHVYILSILLSLALIAIVWHFFRKRITRSR
jgi:hypothetical protein